MSIHHLANIDQARRHHGELIRRAADERRGRRQRRRAGHTHPPATHPTSRHARDG